jgi:hypothetical protein
MGPIGEARPLHPAEMCTRNQRRSNRGETMAEDFCKYVGTLRELSERREPRLEVAAHGKDKLNEEQRWQREYLKASGAVMKAQLRPPADRTAQLPKDHDEMLIHFTVRCVTTTGRAASLARCGWKKPVCNGREEGHPRGIRGLLSVPLAIQRSYKETREASPEKDPVF